jgi:ornithine carbamoyltransferase
LAFIGDGNNVARSLASACYRLGLHFAIASPKGYELEDEFVSKAHDLVPEDAGSVTKHRDPYQAVKDADVVYTDVWASMGQEAEARQRRIDFAGYQVDGKLLAAAKKGALVMHCLPAHRGEEITDEVIEGPQSIVFEQAESRLHVQKGLLKLLMASPEA